MVNADTTRVPALFGGGSVAGPILFPDGAVGAPSISFSSDPDTGIYWQSSGAFRISNNGGARFQFSATSFSMISDASSSIIFGGSSDLVVAREAAAVLQLGTDNAAGAAVDQTLSAADAITAADISGGDLTIQSGAGMGTGTVSALIFQTPTVAAAGANPQSLATRLTLDSAAATFTGGVNIGSSNGFHFSSRTFLLAPSDGVAQFTNNATTDFDTLRLGPTASADTGVVTLESMNSGTAGFMITSNTAASGGADNGIILRTVGDLASADYPFQVQDNNGSGILFRISGTGQADFAGNITGIFRIITNTDCASSAAPAVCSAAPAGSVVIAAAGTTVTVNTTAVSANSQILIQEDSSLGTKLSVTCNTTTGRDYTVTARTGGTSFVITASAAPVTNPACLSYFIVN